MSIKEKKPETVFRIIDKSTGKAEGVYSRAYHDEYDFKSAAKARASNCHGIYENKEEYQIAEYRVTYELINSDVDED